MPAPIASETLIALCRDLDRTAELFADLDVTITRTDAIGPRGDGVSGGGHDQPLILNDRASEARRGLLRALRHAATAPPMAPRALAPEAAARIVVDMLLGDVPTWMHEQARALLAAYTTAWGAIDSPGHRRIVGHCATPECGTVLYAPENRDVIECRRCGREHPARVVRGLMVESAAEYQGTAAELANLLPHYYDAKVQANTIRQWHHRGKLMGCVQADGRTLFRIGDVLGLHRVGHTKVHRLNHSGRVGAPRIS